MTLRRLLPLVLAVLTVTGTGRAAPAPGTGGGVIVWSVEPAAKAGSPAVREGDRITGWRSGDRSGPVADALDWLWFLEEWAPRGHAVVQAERTGRPLSVALPGTGVPFEAGPSLPASLQRSVGAALAACRKGKVPRDPALAVLEERIGRSAGPRAVLWLQLTAARRLHRAGECRTALETSRRAVKAARALDDPHALLLALDTRAAVLLAVGRAEEAAAVCREALEAAGEGDGTALVRATALGHLGVALRGQGRLDEARHDLEASLALRRRLAPGSLAEADALCQLAAVVGDQGHGGRAQALVRRALSIQEERAPESLDRAESLDVLGRLVAEAGDLEGSDALHRRALAIRKALLGRPGLEKSLYGLAINAGRRRDLDTASRLLGEARAILEEGGCHEDRLARVLGVEMILAMQRGDFAEAENLGSRALEIHERLDPGSLYTAICLVNLGAVASGQGDLDRAGERYRRSLEILRKVAPGGRELPMVLANLADLDLSRGRYEEAAPRFREILERLDVLGADDVQRAQVLQNLAFALYRLDRLDEAERRAREALALRRKTAPGSRDEGQSVYLLAGIQETKGALDEASRTLARAEAIMRGAAPGTVFLAEILYDAGRLRLRRGHRDGAIAAYREAIDTLEEQIRRLGGTEAVRSAFRSRYTDWYRELESLLVESGRPEEAFHVLERSRARSLLAMLSEHEITVAGSAARRLEHRRAELARRYDATLSRLAGAAPEERPGLRDQLEAIRRQQDDLEEVIRRSSPRLAAVGYPEPIDAAGARRLLRPGETALLYSVGDAKTLLFVVTRDRLTALTLPVTREEIEHGVSLYRGLVLQNPSAPGRAQAVARAAATLGEALLGPVRASLRGTQTVVVVPDGPLNRLPLTALEVDGTPLAERFAVAVEPSLTVLAELRHHRGSLREASLLALANPGGVPARIAGIAFRGGTVRDLPPVPGTVEEVRAIAATWHGPARVLTGPEATEAALLRLAPGAAVVHLAAHVLLDGEHPLESAIALTPDPDGKGNGLLQGWEVLQSVRLDGGLVTLSGCESGLGRERDGEGLVGLARAFEIAGADAVVGSLWRVDDRLTAALMERFYSRLATGTPAAEALRGARLALRNEPPSGPGLLLSVARFLGLAAAPSAVPPSDPAAWAAFQLSGDPGFVVRAD